MIPFSLIQPSNFYPPFFLDGGWLIQQQFYYAVNIAMTAITTKSFIKVKPFGLRMMLIS